MNSDPKLSVQVGMLYIIKRTRLIGLVIIAGVFVIFAAGVLMKQAAADKEYEFMNIAGFVFCLILCGASIIIRNRMTAKVNAKNYQSAYFTANILPFAMCDAGGIICVTASLFINWNLIYAAAGLVVMAASVIYNFPKDSEAAEIAARIG